MSSLTFVDEHRQWFKSRVGISAKETSRHASFCAYAIQGQEIFIVEDATADPRFAQNPYVVGPPHLRFYAGMPLVAPGGLSLGTLCVLDTVPRRLSPEQARILRRLAESAMRVLALRRNLGAALYAKAVDMTSDGITIAAGPPHSPSIVYANESFLRFTGYRYYDAIGQPGSFPAAGDCPQVLASLKEAATKGQMTTVECHFRKRSGEKVWDRISFVPYIDQHCAVVYMVAVHRDISQQKEAELHVQQLHAMRTTLATVDHVVKNFMNAAQLFALQAASGKPIDRNTREAFDSALESTRLQLAAIHNMPAFRDRPTPFGLSLLDTEDRTMLHAPLVSSRR
jgi:PAS domain S-box-containing protein